MNLIPTPHIEVTDKTKIASTVLMPGDPLRAKFIAENFLTDVVKINSVRNMFAYTGVYNGKSFTIFPSGMGMPSIGIYSYELFKFYDVENIIRVGSAGAYDKNLKLYDIVIADSAYSESSFAKTQCKSQQDNILKPSETLTNKLVESAKNNSFEYKKACIHSSDIFYRDNFEEFKDINEKYGCVAVEMESFALFHNANVLNKNAACILTISDSLVSSEKTTSTEREQSFGDMIKIALNA